MKTITIAVQKGGAGKTTIAVHLAVAAQQAGLRVALADTDPQGSAKSWAETRS
ncbi:ParA family protein, partial [Xanthomonas campestris pv. campestris]|nr:ParA family protein [Xanthomonas campestris pv. campestris]